MTSTNELRETSGYVIGNSDVSDGIVTKLRGFDSQQGLEIFVLRNVQSGSCTDPVSYSMVTEGRAAEFKNEWIGTSVP
jgi:hypothetical protein